jgi:Ser/Thr protein kinase RdoA (MazF antagonist)
MGSRLQAWLAWSPTDPSVLAADSPDVVRLADRISPGSPRSDLGGWTSLNLHLQSAGMVLRVHGRFLTARRVSSLRRIRRHAADAGLLAAAPQTWNGHDLLACAGRVAELETFVPHAVPPANWDTHRWLFAGVGRLHRALRGADIDVPRPVDSLYAPPSTLRRWMTITRPAVRRDRQSREVVRMIDRLVRTLRAQWVPATVLPNHLIHGDLQLGNIGAVGDQMLYLDFGCAAVRPRIHDLATALAWILHAHPARTPESFAWDRLPELIACYEDAAHTTITPLERTALGPYLSTVPLYLSAIAGYLDNPIRHLHDGDRRSFLDIADWILAHPEALLQ